MSDTGRRKYLFVLSMILIVISFGLLIASNIFIASPSLSTMLMTLSLMLLITAWWLYFLEKRAVMRAMKEQPETAVSVIRCKSCDYREERGFQRGDYIFRVVGVCPKCGGEEYIAYIYGVPGKQTLSS